MDRQLGFAGLLVSRLACAWLMFHESLRDIKTGLRAVEPKRSHAGFRGRVSRRELLDLSPDSCGHPNVDGAVLASVLR